MQDNRLQLPDRYPYYLVLTHDVDRISTRELPVGRKWLGNLYRILRSSYTGDGAAAPLSTRLSTVRDIVRVKLGAGNDPTEAALFRMLKIEQELGVNSSLYFIVKPFTNGERGLLSGAYHDSRICYYDFRKQEELLKHCVSAGCEVGVHGIDAWLSEEFARDELNTFREVSGQNTCGIRMHYLYHQPLTPQYLERAGFRYDSTIGSNYLPGFPGDRYHPYRPAGCNALWELPIVLQDQAVVAPDWAPISFQQSQQLIDLFLSTAKQHHAVVTALWHPDRFNLPQDYTQLYKYLIERALKDGAWVGAAGNLLDLADQSARE